jgi:hypothetical protein
MAWLGGGSLAAGGGGVALGATALNVVTVGPALLVAGLVFNGKGEKAVTQAREYEARVAVAVEEQAAFRNRLGTVNDRVRELSVTLRGLVSRAQASLHDVEQVPFDPAVHVEMFDRTMRLAMAVREFCLVPVLGDGGALNSDTEKLIIKYREME